MEPFARKEGIDPLYGREAPLTQAAAHNAFIAKVERAYEGFVGLGTQKLRSATAAFYYPKNADLRSVLSVNES